MRASRLQRPASSAGSAAWHMSRAAATSGASSALATTASNSSPETTAADARARARRARAPRGERARRATPGAPPMPRLAAMLPRDRQPRRARATRALRDHTHTQRAALPHTQRLRTPQALVPLPHPRHVTRHQSGDNPRRGCRRAVRRRPRAPWGLWPRNRTHETHSAAQGSPSRSATPALALGCQQPHVPGAGGCPDDWTYIFAACCVPRFSARGRRLPTPRPLVHIRSARVRDSFPPSISPWCCPRVRTP